MFNLVEALRIREIDETKQHKHKRLYLILNVQIVCKTPMNV